MRVFRNLFGNGSKIHADEIIVGTEENHELMSTAFKAHLAENATEDVHGLLSGGKIIEESGSNSNGNYTKFADGTMICWSSVSSDFTNLTSSYALPATFVARPAASISAGAVASSFHYPIFAGAYLMTNATSWTIRIPETTDNSPTGSELTLLAIGRWK